jgi:hypothetical protein
MYNVRIVSKSTGQRKHTVRTCCLLIEASCDPSVGVKKFQTVIDNAPCGLVRVRIVTDATILPEDQVGRDGGPIKTTKIPHSGCEFLREQPFAFHARLPHPIAKTHSGTWQGGAQAWEVSQTPRTPSMTPPQQSIRRASSSCEGVNKSVQPRDRREAKSPANIPSASRAAAIQQRVDICQCVDESGRALTST